MTAISVVITTFNRAGLVPLAIESVLAQTHPAAEIIVVDDGSADNTPEILARYGSKIRAIRQANAGLSAARNTGILAAQSEWVAFLDDDDEFAPERLAVAAEGIKLHPKVDVHVVNTAIVSENAPTLNLFDVRGVKATNSMEVARPLPWVLRGCFFAQSLVARRSVLEAAGLYRKTFYEDMDMYVRLTMRKPWVIDGRPVLRLIRRGNTDAMSDDWRSRPVQRCEALVRIHREVLALPDLTPSELALARTGLGTYLFDLGAAFSGSGDGPAARRAFSEAARTYPTLRSRGKAFAASVGGRPFLNLLQRLTPKRKSVVR